MWHTLLDKQECANCAAECKKNSLASLSLLCVACANQMSPRQESRLWQVYAERDGQMCQAKWPNGRPCWGQTKVNASCCRGNPACPANPRNTSSPEAA